MAERDIIINTLNPQIKKHMISIMDLLPSVAVSVILSMCRCKWIY